MMDESLIYLASLPEKAVSAREMVSRTLMVPSGLLLGAVCTQVLHLRFWPICTSQGAPMAWFPFQSHEPDQGGFASGDQSSVPA